MAGNDRRAHGCGIANGGGQTTALAFCGLGHAASGRRNTGLQRCVGGRCGLFAMPRGRRRIRSQVSRSAPGAKANPSLSAHAGFVGTAIRTEAKQAKADPALLASFDALRLNLGTMDVEVSLLLQAGTWAGVEGDAEASGPCEWGVDLGTSAAQSAVAAYWPETGRLECIAAFPCEPSLAERGLRDGVGNLYAECSRRGELLTLGKHAADISMLLAAALDRFGRPSVVVADRWREAELRDALTPAGVPFCPLEFRGMGFKDGAEDVRAFQRAVADGRVIPVASLLLRSSMSEARTVSDPAGNSKLSKNTEGGRRKRAKDDAAAAAILAVAAGVRQPAVPKRSWRYHGMTG